MKPELSRGDIQIIGATTLAEYSKYIEKDSALERRFQPVMIEQPSVEQAKKILRNGQLLILRDGKIYNVIGQEL